MVHPPASAALFFFSWRWHECTPGEWDETRHRLLCQGQIHHIRNGRDLTVADDPEPAFSRTGDSRGASRHWLVRLRAPWPPCRHLPAPGGVNLCSSQLGRAPPLLLPLLLLLRPLLLPILPPGKVSHGRPSTVNVSVSQPSIWIVLASLARSQSPLVLLPGGRPGPVTPRSALASRATGAVSCSFSVNPLIHFVVERLGDVIQLLRIHAGEGSLHVPEEPSNSMPRLRGLLLGGDSAGWPPTSSSRGRVRGPVLPIERLR